MYQLMIFFFHVASKKTFWEWHQGAKAVKRINHFQGRIKDVMLKYIPYTSEALAV